MPGGAVPHHVGNLGAVITLAAAGVGLAVVPRRAIDPDLPLDVCDLEDPWSRRRHLLCRGARAGSSATALAEHLRRAAENRNAGSG